MKTVSKLLLIPMSILLVVGLVPARQTETLSPDREPAGRRTTFDLSKIDESITKEFRKAWDKSHQGIDNRESVVLIFQNVDGSYRATTLGVTNQSNRVTFRWNPAAIAIVHTHPSKVDPKPTLHDMQTGDRIGVPIFTITRWGMFMYDPGTKQITEIQHNLDWLSASKWNHNSQ